MTVRVTREAEPQFELYGAFEGEVLGGPVNTIASLTFTATGDYLIVVPKNQDQMSEPQVELGSTCSSHIPTSTSTVTRAADVMTIPAANLPWPEPEIIGPELVTNGTFDTDTDGWETRQPYGTISVVGGECFIDNGATGGFSGPSQAITVVSGKVYQATATVRRGTGAERMLLTAGPTKGSGAWGIVETSLSGDQSLSLVFVAQGTTAHVSVAVGSGAEDEGYTDNISVREINPLAVSIQMEGTMTYADEDSTATVQFANWATDVVNSITVSLDTVTAGSTIQDSGIRFQQILGGVVDRSTSPSGSYSPGVNVAFNIASRHGSTFINGAVDGTALTADTTPTALPDLETADMQVSPIFMGTIKLFRMWADDITDEGIAEASA